jgi:acyl carrier protein
MDVTSAATLADVRSVVVTTLGIEDRADTLDASTPLLGGLPELDSMAVVELVAALEERFGITIDDEDVTGEVFETLGSLAAFVDGKRG